MLGSCSSCDKDEVGIDKDPQTVDRSSQTERNSAIGPTGFYSMPLYIESGCLGTLCHYVELVLACGGLKKASFS